jgi:two-component sensor histidine kinase
MQKIFKSIFLTLFLMNCLYGDITIDESVQEVVLLNKSKIYLDTSDKENINSLISKPELFIPHDKEYINYGINKNTKHPLWIKFILLNTTSQTIHRTLSFDEYFLEHIELYIVKNKKVLEKRVTGSSHRKEFSGIIRAHFQLEILPNTSKTYYVKVFTPGHPLAFKAMLTTYETFIYEDIKYHVIWALFICILVSVLIYNLILFFLTKDSIYFYYALYILGILAVKRVHYLLLLYIFPMHDPNVVEKELSLIVYGTNFTALTMILFTQHFLQTKAYPRLHKFLNFLIGVIFVHSIVTTADFLNYHDIALFYLFITIFLYFVGFYALYKKNKNASYFIFGWGLSVFAWFSALLNGMNIWNNRYDFYYMTETFIVLEVFLFSYAIAKYIRKLTHDKEKLSKKLIEQKEDENIRLEKVVNEKTEHLDTELKKSTFLLQELNHRVKNNMQFITSLYALKLGDNVDIQEKLQDVERKVQAMSQVHQMLYTQKNLDHIEADNYFETIIQNIQAGFNQENIKFIYNIQISLNLEEAIYCGLIVNELVTNAVKYAFPDNKGKITIVFTEDEDFKYLKVHDNGVGIQKNDTSGFGQILIETLAVEQLGGEVYTDTTNGTQVEIKFKNSKT